SDGSRLFSSHSCRSSSKRSLMIAGSFIGSSEKGRANWPLCPVFPKDRIEGVKAKRPVCPTPAPRFSSFQGVAARHKGSSKKSWEHREIGLMGDAGVRRLP